MDVEEFIVLCRAKGWHFTANWVTRKLMELKSLNNKDLAIPPE